MISQSSRFAVISGLIRANEFVKSILVHFLLTKIRSLDTKGLNVLKKASLLTQQKVESFGEAVNEATELFTGQKRRLYQHRALCA